MKKWRSICLLFLFVVLCNPFLCFYLLTLVDRLYNNLVSLGGVENFIGVEVPPNATNIQHVYCGFQDHHAQIRFDMPASDFEAWFDQYEDECPQGLEENKNPFLSSACGADWWDTQTAQIYMGQTCELPSPVKGFEEHTYITFEILVDKTDNTFWTVYLSD